MSGAKGAALLQLTHDSIIVRDMQDRITFWNRGATARYGWTEREVIGQVTHTLLQTEFPQPLPQIMAELMHNGRWEGELAHVCRDGTRITVSSRQVLQCDPQGQPLAILEINNDITEQKRAERALRNLNTELEQRVADRTAELQATNAALREQMAEYEESQARFRALFESLPDLAVVFQRTDSDFVLVEYNRAAMAMTRGRIPELLGKTTREIYSERADIAEHIERAYQERTTLEYTTRYRQITTGEEQYQVATFAFVPPDRVMAHAKDITQSKRAEDEIRTLNGQLQDRTMELQTAIQQMEVANDELMVANQELAREIGERSRAQAAQQRTNERLQLLSDISAQLLASKDPQALVEELCTRVMRHLDCQTFFNFILDPACGKLHLNAYAGIPESAAREIEWLDLDVAVCGAVARSGQRIVATDVQNTPDPRTALIKTFGVQAYACHPLMAQGEVIGTLSFGSRNKRDYADDDLELMRTVTDQVAIAMQRIRTEQALRASEERYRLAAQATNDAIWDIDLATGTTRWNDRYATLFGRPPETSGSWKWWIDHIHPDDRDRTLNSFRSAIDGRESTWTCEYRFQRADGAWAYIYDRAYIARDESGRAWRAVGAMLDLTERKQAEDELRQVSQILAYHMENSPLAVIEWGPDMRLTRWSGAAEKIFGWKAEQVLGKRMQELRWIYQEDEEQVIQVSEHLRAGTGSHRFSANRNYRKDGSVIDCEWYNSSLLDESGKMRSILSLVLDVTERNRAERELADSRRRLYEVLDSIQDDFYVLDRDWRFVFTSKQFTAKVGKEPRDFIGNSIWEMFPKHIGTPFEENLRATMEKGETRRFEVGGKYTDACYSMTCFPSPDGITVLGTDITVRNRIEKALRESQERLNFSLEKSRTGGWDLDLVDHTAIRTLEHDRIFGYDTLLPQWTYEMFLDHVLPEDRAEVDKGFRESIATQSDWNFECRIRREDGQVRWIWAVGGHSPELAGGPHRMAGIVQDITERKEAEEKIRHHNAVLAGISQIFQQALTSMTDQELAITCLSVAEQVTSSKFGFVGELNAEGILDNMAVSDPGWDRCRMLPKTVDKRLPSGFKVHGLYGKVVTDGKGFYTNEPASHPESIGLPEGHPPLTAFLGVPLVHNGKTIGMIGLGNRDGGYRDEELHAAASIANASVQALVRKRAERAMQESERRERARSDELAAVLDAVPAAVWIAKDPLGEYISGNRLAQEWMRVPQGMNMSLSAPEDVRPATFALYQDGIALRPDDMPVQRSARGEEIRDCELEMRYVDGTTRTIVGNATALRDSEGKAIGSVSAFIDITQRKQTEVALQKTMQVLETWTQELEQARADAESEQRLLQAVMDALPVGVAIIDGKGGNIRSNGAFEEVWGAPRPRTTSVGDYTAYKAWWAGTSTPVAPEEWAAAVAIQRGEPVVGQVFEIERFDGTRGSVINSASPIRDRTGQIIGAAVAIQDITELRRVEESLREAMRRIQNLNVDMEQRTNELEVANEELERLAMSLAYDLRAPLISINSVSNAILEDYKQVLPPEASKLFELIHANTKEMDQLTSGLVRLMRITRQPVHKQTLDMNALVRSVWEESASERGDRQVEFAMQDLPWCEGDPVLLREVWLNLILNALKFTRTRPVARIEIGTRQQEDQTVYFICDNGVGFDMAYAGRIFRAFQRYHHPEEYEGSGVGLAIVEGIIRRHGGRVWAEGNVERGATFYMMV